MRLYVVRHGIAIDRNDPASPADPARALTADGILKTQAAARGFRALGAAPEVFLTSPYTRALETAELFAAAFDVSKSALRKTAALKPCANPRAIFQEIAKLNGKDVACFGHATHLDEMISLALGAKGAATALKKAGIACLEMKSAVPPQATIGWLLTGKMLRALAR
ncbi:MAG: SixA phosphatase family protein [bacterium]